MTKYFMFTDTPAGTALLTSEDDIITGLHWKVFKRAPLVQADWVEDTAPFQTLLGQLEEYFAGKRQMSRPSTLMRSLIAERAGLNMTDAECIDYLIHADSATATDLVKMTGLSKSAVSSVVARLERAGYISREVDPRDKRRTLLVPNVRLARQRFGPYYAAVTSGFQDIVAHYTDKEMVLIAAHYERMTALYEQQVELLSNPDYKGMTVK